ncbi:protein FAM240C [Antechinus flavipes]|uniref:protein FAM240C n=1 Tax=Antechinus flavipes TaxID=38775 RepID=UPI00223636EB|nr:protein FAM240C [Antechinus flavipes]
MSKNYRWKHPEMTVHDAGGLKNFWEKKIEHHAKQVENENSRISRSALDKLRCEWTRRLEGRLKMLQQPQEEPKKSSLLPIESFHLADKTVA